MPTTSAFRPGGGGAGAIMGRLAETGDVRKPAGPPPAYRPMAEICLAQQVSGSAACSAQIPEGKSSAFQRVCSQCSLPEGFEVDRDNIRRVPKEDLLALRQWGPNAFGAFRDAPMQFGSFKYCLINDSSDLSRARERPHKGHPHDEALVLILPGSGSPSVGWSTPSPVEYGQQGVPEGKFRLYVRHKTIVADPPRGGGARRASIATSTATPQAPPMEGEGLSLEPLGLSEELSLLDFDPNSFLESSPAAAPAPAETLGDVNLLSHRESAQPSLAVTAANDVGSTSAAHAATGPSPSSSSAPTPTVTPPMQRQDGGPRKRVSTGLDDRQSTVYVSNLTPEEQQRTAKDLIRAGLRMLESSRPLSESQASALNNESESDIVFRSSAGSTSGDRGASTPGGSNRRASSGDCGSDDSDGPPTIRGMRR